MTLGATTMSANHHLSAASPALVMLGRAGYAAKGVVYVVMGVLAARAAMGAGGKATDSRGALHAIGDGPFGTAAVALIGVGLLGYMMWRLVAAATDAEGKGNEPTSLVMRAAQAARGLAYGALGVQALRLLVARGSAESHAARDWTARLLGLPFGRAIVAALGLGVLGYAGYQLYRAAQDKAGKHLGLAEAGREQAKWIVRLGRFGTAARAVVFAMIGVFLMRAAMQRDSGEAGGIAQSLRALASGDYGALVLGAVAFGLMAYGVFQLATARYRYMRAVG
ncbi:MAG: DUF1206 domain-containing protein [Gemmatimonadaceae bacterium]